MITPYRPAKIVVATGRTNCRLSAVVQQPAGTAEPRDPSPQSLPPKGDVVGIFPNRLSARRLVGAVLAEQHDEWAEARRYLTIPNAAGNEALPTPNMLDPAA